MATRVTRSTRQQPQANEQQNRARWTAPLTKTLAELMVEQVCKGNRQSNSFGKKAWTEICADFYKRTGLKWDMEQLRYRYTVLRKQYLLVKLLLDTSDFTWDETKGTFLGDDQAWVECIREHPEAEALKTNGCPIYKELCVIFSKPETNGGHSQSAEHSKGRDAQEQEPSSESEELDDLDHREAAQPATASSTGAQKRGRKGIDDAISDAILEMASASRMKTEAIQRHNARYSITKCIQELDNTQGVEEWLYHAALDLFDKPIAREVFLSLKGGNRLVWLRSKCMAYYPMH